MIVSLEKSIGNSHNKWIKLRGICQVAAEASDSGPGGGIQQRVGDRQKLLMI